MRSRTIKEPRFARWVLSLLSKYDEEFISCGDIGEEFKEIADERGSFKAHLWYWAQVLYAIPSYCKHQVVWGIVMFNNYLKIAFRNLKRQKVFSLINVSGIVVGLTSVILITLYIKYELSYDTFHGKADTIYRIYVELPGNQYVSSRYFGGSPALMAQTLMDELPEVVNATKIGRRTNTLIKYRDKSFYENGIYAEKNFLDIFNFPLSKGDPGIALNDPYSIIISETLARKLFQYENPIGKTLNIDQGHDFKITGVHKDVPGNSHLQFSFMVSFATLTVNKSDLRRLYMWDVYMYFNYIVLPENYNVKELEKKIAIVLNKHEDARAIIELDGTIYRLQPLKKIHLHSKLNNEIAVNNSDIKYIYLFAVLGFAILVIASINNMNLTTARASKRTKEIGIRKVIGTTKKQLFTQFIVESFVLIIIGSLIALVAVGCILPWFKAFVNRDIEIGLFQNMDLIALLVGIVLLTGLLSSCYPALFLSLFQPVKVLKGNYHSSLKGAKFRNILVMTQFSVSVFLIAVTLTVFKQLKFMMTADTGYDKDHIVVLKVRDGEARQRYTVIKNRLLQHRNITSVTSSSWLPSEILGRRTFKINVADGREATLSVCEVYADYNYLDFYGIELIKGRNFSKEFSTDENEAVIINETTGEQLGWKEPIGKNFHDWGKVIGVVKDFHSLSFHHEIMPLSLTLSPNDNFFISIKIQNTEVPETIAYLNQVFAEFSDYPFTYEFFNELYYRQYQSEQHLGSLLGCFSGLSLFIACFGLFGLALFEAQRKTKEIGIRKILGASVITIVKLLSKEYIKLIIISCLIAYPFVHIYMNKWLRKFAYRVERNYSVFIVSFCLILIIAFMTVAYQAIKAARANLVDSLRYE